MNDLFIGLMSGTSMDSIDAALVKFNGKSTQVINAISYPWRSSLKEQLRSITLNQSCSLATLGELDSACGDNFADAVVALLSASQISANQISAIGSHGQTLSHGPYAKTPFSLQIGDPNRIVEKTQITTVADFRRRDLAAGGQGAPLVPAFHESLFNVPDENRVILNIGGIANISLFDNSNQQYQGFDTGPGNCLMDHWITKSKNFSFDKNGTWATQGNADHALLSSLLSDDYFSRSAPKSTGTEYFSPSWLAEKVAQFTQHLTPADIQATLLELTAVSISQAILNSTTQIDRILVCGGGIHNAQLIARLSQIMAGVPIESTSQYGIDPDWVEAVAFAWLAKQRLNQQPGNMTEATGARKPVILGGLYTP